MLLTTRSLDVSTWDAFVELVERNNGIYGGCWCIVHVRRTSAASATRAP
jgi:hypothetical protein